MHETNALPKSYVDFAKLLGFSIYLKEFQKKLYISKVNILFLINQLAKKIKADNYSVGQEISFRGSGKSITLPIEGHHDSLSCINRIHPRSSTPFV